MHAEQQVSRESVKNDRAGGVPYTVMLGTKLAAEEHSDTVMPTVAAT